LSYDLALYAAVNGSLYRYFAIVGGVYQLTSIVAVVALALRGRHEPHARWRWAAALGVTLSFISWLILVQPVNSIVAAGVAWTEGLRLRWELGHLVGFALTLAGFVALVAETVLQVPAHERTAGAEVGHPIRTARPVM